VYVGYTPSTGDIQGSARLWDASYGRETNDEFYAA